MPTPTTTAPITKPEYNPRWFIWTIVFLVITGISLVSYIVLSDTGANDVPDFAPARTQANRSK